jgi:hypothetical protein
MGRRKADPPPTYPNEQGALIGDPVRRRMTNLEVSKVDAFQVIGNELAGDGGWLAAGERHISLDINGHVG